MQQELQDEQQREADEAALEEAEERREEQVRLRRQEQQQQLREAQLRQQQQQQQSGSGPGSSQHGMGSYGLGVFLGAGSGGSSGGGGRPGSSHGRSSGFAAATGGSSGSNALSQQMRRSHSHQSLSDPLAAVAAMSPRGAGEQQQLPQGLQRYGSSPQTGLVIGSAGSGGVVSSGSRQQQQQQLGGLAGGGGSMGGMRPARVQSGGLGMPSFSAGMGSAAAGGGGGVRRMTSGGIMTSGPSRPGVGRVDSDASQVRAVLAAARRVLGAGGVGSEDAEYCGLTGFVGVRAGCNHSAITTASELRASEWCHQVLSFLLCGECVQGELIKTGAWPLHGTLPAGHNQCADTLC